MEEQKNNSEPNRAENQKTVLAEGEKKESFFKKHQPALIPLAIIVAGGLIGSGIFGGFIYQSKYPSTAKANTGQEEVAGAVAVKAVSAEDHIKGSPDAKVKLITYTDLDCPYCANMNKTANSLLQTYKSDQLALVYRQFPLTELHPTAERKAEASECVAELGGNDAFWNFVDLLFADQKGLKTDEQLSQTAVQAGVNKENFISCLNSGKYASKIKAQTTDVIAAGGRGTPYNVLVSGDTSIPIVGAQLETTFKQKIDALLK